jgi:hypothetical protein
MIKSLLIAAVLSSLPVQPVAPAGFTAPAITLPGIGDIRFTVTRRDRDGQAQLSLIYGEGSRRGNSSGPQPWAELVGLTLADLDRTPPSPAVFRIERPAGVIACSGLAGGGEANGDCGFEADAGYSRALVERGLGTPEPRQMFQLALQDFELETLAELERQGYARPELDDLVAAAIHNVDAAYVRGIADAGYRLGGLEDLIAFRIHDVTPEYIAAMAQLGDGFVRLPADQLLAMSIHGVTPEFAREMAALGYVGESPDQLVAMRIHRVTPQFVRALAELGYRDLSSQSLIAFSIHGVTPDYIRQMKSAGHADLSANQLVALRIHGRTPGHRPARIRLQRAD